MTTGHLEYYTRLGVDPSATVRDLRNAFARLVVTAHPDRGGDEAAFASLHEAYEVLIDERKRRIYDRYGPEALQRTAESLFSETFRAGEFKGVHVRDDARELEALRRENDTLQRQMLILKPETENKYAGSFESWVRNRNPQEQVVVTSDTLMKTLGVCEDSYDQVELPPLQSLTLEYTTSGVELPEAIQCRRYDLPRVLKWGQVLVHMLAAPVTRLDRQLARFYALHDAAMPPFPAPAGTEGVGVVLRVGPGVETLKEGGFVLPLKPTMGTWRSLAVMTAVDLLPFPATTLTPAVVSTFYSFLAAYRLLEDFGSLRPGDTIIQSGAESLVGMAVIQMAKILKINTINLVEDSENFDNVSDTLHALGANYVWRNVGSLQDRLKKTRGAALPRLGLDCVGNQTLTRMCECMFPGGTVVVYGTLANKSDRFPYIPLMYKEVTLRGFWLWHWLKEHSDAVPEVVDKILPLMEQHKFELDVQHWKQIEDSFHAALQEPNAVLEFATLESARATLQGAEH